MDFKAGIFDLDGTLVDSLFLWREIWREFGEKYLGDKNFYPNEDDDKAFRVMALADSMNMMHAHYGLGESGKQLFDAVTAKYKDFYSNRVQLKPGVRKFLEYAHKNGIKMCLASATARDLLDITLERCGIKHYFSEILSCAEIGKGKENPDIFYLAQELLGTTLEETCVFEDSLVAIQTASKIGMQTVGIYDDFNPHQDIIKSLATEYIGKGETLEKLI